MSVLQDLERLILPVKQLNDDGAPTASIAILEDGSISAHVITAGRENTDTVYQACSISKAMTGLAIAKMVDLGLTTYDTKVVDHLSASARESLGEGDSQGLLRHVTVHMLLSHTSGLSQGGFPGFPEEPPAVELVLAGRHHARTPKIVFNSIPGSQLQYSGGGFILLQLMMEKVMDMPFARVMERLLFEPLSMTRSRFAGLASGETNFAKAHLNGYTGTDAEYHRWAELAAAGLWTTPTDLLKATLAVQRSLSMGSGLLTRETARRMLTVAGSSPEAGAFGMGWAVDDQYFGHTGGNDPGYMSWLVGSHGLNGDPQLSNGSIGLAVMINSHYSRWRVLIPQIVSAIFYLKGWKRYRSLPGDFGADSFAPHAAPASPTHGEKWKAWIGEWEHGWILIDSDGPKLVGGSSIALPLKPAAAPASDPSAGKKELVYVIDGVRTGVRLTWHDEEQVVEVLGAAPKTLRRLRQE